MEHISRGRRIYRVYTQEDISIKMTNKKDTNMSFFDRLSPNPSSTTPTSSSVATNTNQSTRRDDNINSIAVIVGKTFEATSLPDGSQQIIEVTKYKRLSDGYVYTESKLRSLEDVEEDDMSETPRSQVGGGVDVRDDAELNNQQGGGISVESGSIQQRVPPPPPPPSSLVRHNISPHSQQRHRQQQPRPTRSPQRQPSHSPTKHNYPESDILSTFSSSYSSAESADENGTNFMSVITEDHAMPSGGGNRGNEYGGFVEEYLYDDDPIGFAQWQNDQHQTSSAANMPRTASGVSNTIQRNNSGWCPFGDGSIADDSLQVVNNMNVKRGLWASPARLAGRGLRVKTFFHTNNESSSNEVPLDLTNGRLDSDGITDEEKGQQQRGARYGRNKSRMPSSKKHCKVWTIAILLVVIGSIVAIALLVPSNQNTPSKQIENDDTQECIHLQIVMSTTEENSEQDTNSWSLTRVNNEDNNNKIVTIKSSDFLPEQTDENDETGDSTHTYKKCVDPGVYTFTISDSSGNGLGTDGSKSGYYITANEVTLGVSSFFFHEEKMTFTLPFVPEEEHISGGEEIDTVCTDDFFLAIKTDGNPNQTSWNVIDNNTEEEVLTGGPYDLPWTVYTHRACLPNGSYTFNMVDEGGDGVCCEDGKGFFMLQKDGKTIVKSDGEFGSEKSVGFALGEEEV